MVKKLLFLSLFVAGMLFADGFEYTLFNFEGEEPAKGWSLNIWGKNKKGKKGEGGIEVVEGRTGGFALRLYTKKAGSFNFVSPLIKEGDWQKYKYSGLSFWYKGDGTKRHMVINLYTSRPEGKGFYNYYTIIPAPAAEGEWQRLVLKSFRPRPKTPPIDLSRLRRITIGSSGTREITIDDVYLIGEGRNIVLEENKLPQVVVPLLSSAPVLDGILNDPVWKQAAKITDFHTRGAERAPKYPTEVYVGYKNSILYIGAHLKGEQPDKIPARHKISGTHIWKDSCLEFYLDPGKSNKAGAQFIINSIGTKDVYTFGKGWEVKWDAVARVDAKDGWFVEIACDLSGFGAQVKPGAVWGFNLKRHVAKPEGGYIEISGWSQTRPQPVSGYGTIIFGPASATQVTTSEIEMREVKEGSYVCRIVLSNTGKEKKEVVVRAVITRPGAEELTFTETTDVEAGKEAIVNIPLMFDIKEDGRHLLDITVLDDKGLPVSYKQYSFLLSKVRKVNYKDIVLWPPPQKWQLKDGYWVVPESVKISVSGKGDAFPSEHLIERLKARYGVNVELAGTATPYIVLEYVKDGIKPEGFILDVETGGVKLKALNGRGMYYGVRAFLDILQQCFLITGKAQARAVYCEDWPAVSKRIVYHQFNSRFPVSVGVQTYKDFIYDQVAGRRYNLLFLAPLHSLRYETHPEVATGKAVITKDELKEIIEFARRHYLDVAPGGNTPGHADWLLHAYPQLREDGDIYTLCTRHPDTMPLLYDIYGELIDLFQPTEYFFLGGDEVRWKTHSVPEEKRCKLCAGFEKRDLLLEHWTALANFCKKKGVRPLLWIDQLSERWTGGAPYHTARILPYLPRNIIIVDWGIGRLTPPVSHYTDLGFDVWRITTSFGSAQMRTFLSWWKNYEGIGIFLCLPWPWTTFMHAVYKKLARGYNAPSIFNLAGCVWKPETAATSWMRSTAENGLHWMKVMQVTDWGTRKITYQTLSISEICNNSTIDEKAGDGTGWMDFGPESNLRNMPKSRVVVGAVPFDRPEGEKDCVIVRGNEESTLLKLNRKVKGLVFLHTAGANRKEINKLYRRFFRKNTSHYGMDIGFYNIRYAEGSEVIVPIKIGWNIHLWNCDFPAAVMQGARAYWAGFTASQKQKDPNTPDVFAWTMEWKNPYPDTAIESITLKGAGTEATVILLGITAVE